MTPRVFVFCLFAVPVLASSDDANWVGVGSAGNFSKNPYVTMKREIVDIRLSDEKMHVRATFWFENHGPAAKVTMAFPDETSQNQFQSNEPQSNRHIIDNMMSAVDGKHVTLSHQTVTGDKAFEVKGVWLKTVSFTRGQTRKVVVDYSAANGFAGSGYVLNSYILRTGSTWRGPIGKCSINVDWTKIKKFSRPALTFSKYFDRGPGPHYRVWRFGHRRASCVLNNLEPDFDLNLGMIDRFWGFTLNGKPVPSWVGISDFDEPVKGPRSDIQIPFWMTRGFFGQGNSMENERGKGGELRNLRLIDRSTVEFNGRRHKLRRTATGPIPPFSEQNSMGEDPTYIHLRDIVKACRGTYRYDPFTELVHITIPPQKRLSRITARPTERRRHKAR